MRVEKLACPLCGNCYSRVDMSRSHPAHRKYRRIRVCDNGHAYYSYEIAGSLVATNDAPDMDRFMRRMGFLTATSSHTSGG